jgi:hypothetical protein
VRACVLDASERVCVCNISLSERASVLDASESVCVRERVCVTSLSVRASVLDAFPAHSPFLGSISELCTYLCASICVRFVYVCL